MPWDGVWLRESQQETLLGSPGEGGRRALGLPKPADGLPIPTQSRVAWGLSPVPGLSLGDRVTRGHGTFPKVFCAHRRSLPALAQCTGYSSRVRSTSGSAPGTPNHCGPQAPLREPTQAVEPSLCAGPFKIIYFKSGVGLTSHLWVLVGVTVPESVPGVGGRGERDTPEAQGRGRGDPAFQPLPSLWALLPIPSNDKNIISVSQKWPRVLAWGCRQPGLGRVLVVWASARRPGGYRRGGWVRMVLAMLAVETVVVLGLWQRSADSRGTHGRGFGG